MSSTFKDRTGEININRSGSKITISKYECSSHVIVKFENGFKVKTSYRHFKSGNVSSPYDLSVCGIGYGGIGQYKLTDGRKATPEYSKWRGMIKRCYSESSLRKNKNYVGCSVTPEWHNFQNFAKWFNNNFYAIKGEIIELDKDILTKGNRIYGPDTCVFAPHAINSMFVNQKVTRNADPIGVSFHKRIKKFQAYYSKNNKRIYLGYYDTPEEAFEAYKTSKESLIKQTAEEYKGKIPDKLYGAMLNYKVEIDD